MSYFTHPLTFDGLSNYVVRWYSHAYQYSQGLGCNGIFLRARPNQPKQNPDPGLALVLHLAQGTRLTCRTAPIFFSKPRTPLEDAFVYKCERRLAVSLSLRSKLDEDKQPNYS